MPEPAPRAWLELAHYVAYVSDVLEQRLDEAAMRRLGLPLSPELALRSRCAVAGTVLTARLALEHGVACNTAGGSHHAFAGFGAGFCVFNDVAVAARVLLAEGLIRRVLVVDLDVHQGDGTAAMLADDPRVFTLSVHCRTNFPARKQQSDLDVALDAGVGDADYLATVDQLLPTLLDRVRPDLVFYNAGVDPHDRRPAGPAGPERRAAWPSASAWCCDDGPRPRPAARLRRRRRLRRRSRRACPPPRAAARGDRGAARLVGRDAAPAFGACQHNGDFDMSTARPAPASGRGASWWTRSPRR